MIFKKLTLVILAVFALTVITACSGDGDGINAYILKIDGKDVGYVQSETDVAEVISKLSDEKRAELEAGNVEVVKVTVNSKIEGAPALCDENDLLSVDTVVKKYLESGEKISFSVTVNEKETKYVSFETVYKNSSSYYEGTKVVQTKGEQGEKELLYEVTYVDGNENTRELIAETETKKKVDEVVLVGTKKSTASTGKYAWPLKSVSITSSYGGRYLNGSYDYHLGVDLRASSGTTVYAADGGKITFAGYSGSYGYLIKILHDNGDYTYYAHLSKINVGSGTRVYKGQAIAKSGATGNVTGPHLHFEIRKNGSTVNPTAYLPSLRGVTFVYSEAPDSCLGQTEACLFRSERPASLSSKREQEAFL